MKPKGTTIDRGQFVRKNRAKLAQLHGVELEMILKVFRQDGEKEAKALLRDLLSQPPTDPELEALDVAGDIRWAKQLETSVLNSDKERLKALAAVLPMPKERDGLAEAEAETQEAEAQAAAQRLAAIDAEKRQKRETKVQRDAGKKAAQEKKSHKAEKLGIARVVERDGVQVTICEPLTDVEKRRVNCIELGEDESVDFLVAAGEAVAEVKDIY